VWRWRPPWRTTPGSERYAGGPGGDRHGREFGHRARHGARSRLGGCEGCRRRPPRARGRRRRCRDRGSGRGAVFVRTDVTKEADVERLIETALRAYGRLDVAFNNAGTDTMDGVSTSTAVTELEEADWDRIIDVDLKGCG
jgi:NAD(P)-dependent dehydrogenase (short-subunit alcohol dehydrogenase family)